MKVKAEYILIACMFQFGSDYYNKCNYSTNSLQMFLKTPVVSELRTCMLCGVIIIRRSSGFRPHNLVCISSTAAPLPLQGFSLSVWPKQQFILAHCFREWSLCSLETVSLGPL